MHDFLKREGKEKMGKGGKRMADAAKRGDTKRAKVLLREGVDVNISKEGDEGCTALFIAAREGHKDVVDALIAAKAEVNKADTIHGETPLYAACCFGHTAIARMLLEGGANPNLSNREGRSPYWRALEYPEIRKVLRAHGVGVPCCPFM